MATYLMPFDEMNESDVREAVVRPLLERLGYKLGTLANIRTEVSLRRPFVQLGRRKASDPPLRGRADYICDAISYGRWVVEVKAPNEDLGPEDVYQAHSYATHPEVAAAFFLLTNGRTFELYEASRLDKALLRWAFDETEQHLLTLENVLGYDALVRRSRLVRPDVGKPLGRGLPSKAKIVGGTVSFGRHHSVHPLFQNDVINGTQSGVAGDFVSRLEDGRLLAQVTTKGPYQSWEMMNRAAGIENFKFLSSDQFLSTDPDAPSIFQNVFEAHLRAGTPVEVRVPQPMTVPAPIGFVCSAFTQAVGFVEGDEFKGALDFEFHYQIYPGPLAPPPVAEMIKANPTALMRGTGEFNVRFVSAPDQA